MISSTAGGVGSRMVYNTAYNSGASWSQQLSYVFNPQAMMTDMVLGGATAGVMHGLSTWLSSRTQANVSNNVGNGMQSGSYGKANLWERLTKRSINPSELRPSPLDDFSNPRIGPSQGALSRYTREIAQTGKISEPLMVQKFASGGYEIVNGHHRWQAAMNMGLKKVPIKIIN